MLGQDSDVEIPRVRFTPTGATEDREQVDIPALAKHTQLTGLRCGTQSLQPPRSVSPQLPLSGI
ncbi:MAG: hypothetical protein ACRDTH_12000 [Pseudonocardiaceae bacterium]